MEKYITILHMHFVNFNRFTKAGGSMFESIFFLFCFMYIDRFLRQLAPPKVVNKNVKNRILKLYKICSTSKSLKSRK